MHDSIMSPATFFIAKFESSLAWRTPAIGFEAPPNCVGRSRAPLCGFAVGITTIVAARTFPVAHKDGKLIPVVTLADLNRFLKYEMHCGYYYEIVFL
ncbi:MAG: hypothetical protein GY696_08235 [Gammaproteobacteria bacterium]|nr:hypothetical protein [Gammaproteobacteria bacterium]